MTSVLLTLLAIIPFSTQAAWEVLDQSNTGSGSGVRVDSTGSFAQTFKAGISGELSRVALGVVKDSGDLTVEIRTVDGNGFPTGTVLATATVSSHTNPPALTDVVFASPATISANTSYAIVVSTAGEWSWAGTSAAYANGTALICDIHDCWSDIGAQVGMDFKFQTYVRQSDSEPPSGSVSIDSDATYASSTSVTLSLTCQDDISDCFEMQFSTDGMSFSTPVPYATSSSFTLPAGDGAKTVYAQFIDTAGNTSASVSDTIILEQTPPETTITSSLPSSSPTNSTSIIITFSGADENGVQSFECALDSDTYASCTSDFTGSNLADGEHTFRVRAIDQAGNVDTSPASYTWTVDATTPVTTATVDGPQGQDGWYQSATVTLTTDEPTTTTYTVNSGTPQTYSAPFSLTPDGIYTLTFSSIDPVGNEEATQTLTVKVDGSAPVFQPLDDQTLDPTSRTGAPVFFTPNVTDNLSSAGTIAASCVDQFNNPFVSGQYAPLGTTTITCSATDVAGNTGTDSFTVTVLDLAGLFRALDAQINDLSLNTVVRRTLLLQADAAERLANMGWMQASCLQLNTLDLSVHVQEMLRQVSQKDVMGIYTKTQAIRILLGCGGPSR